MFDATAREFGKPPAILVNNAGIQHVCADENFRRTNGTRFSRLISPRRSMRSAEHARDARSRLGTHRQHVFRTRSRRVGEKQRVRRGEAWNHWIDENRRPRNRGLRHHVQRDLPGFTPPSSSKSRSRRELNGSASLREERAARCSPKAAVEAVCDGAIRSDSSWCSSVPTPRRKSPGRRCRLTEVRRRNE